MIWVRSDRSLMLLRIGLISMAVGTHVGTCEKPASIPQLRRPGSPPPGVPQAFSGVYRAAWPG
nr:hypothetical protein [Gammaproteobacteria bacterium]